MARSGKVYSVLVNRFDGGLNTKVSPIHGKLDESPDCDWVIFDDFGAVETARGYTVLDTLASASVDGLHGYVRDDGKKSMVAFCNGTMFTMSEGASTFLSVASGINTFTTGANVMMDNFQNHTWISNGQDNPRKWNGVELTRWGVLVTDSPSSAITQGTAGSLNGTYTWVTFGINSNAVAGDYSSATTAMSLTNENGTLTGLTTQPVSAGIDYIGIGRNKAAAAGVYYKVTQVVNGTVTFADEVADTDLGDALGTDEGLPQKFTVFVHHLEYMFGATDTGTNPDYLYYSNINEPEIFDSDDLIKVGEGDGGKIKGLGVLDNGLIIAKSDEEGNGSVYLLYMPDATPANWTLTRLDTQYGGQAPRVMARFANYLAFMNRYGVFDLNQATLGSIRSDALSFKIEPEIFALNVDKIVDCAAIAWKNKVWLSVPYGASQATNNRVLQFDYVKGRGTKTRSEGAWARFTDLDLSTFAIHDGSLYGGSSNADGRVWTLDTGYNLNGSAIDSYYKTMKITGKPGHENYTKLWRYAYILVECTGEWNMDVTYSSDFYENNGTPVVVNLDPGGYDWGGATSFWGSASYGGEKQQKLVRITLGQSISSGIQFQFRTNTADQYFKVHELTIEYLLRGKRNG